MKNKLARHNNARLLRVLRNWLANEVLPVASGKDQYTSMELWLQSVFKDAILDAARGRQTSEDQIDRILRTEVAKALKISYPTERALGEHIQKLVAAEVRKQVADAIVINATITGTVKAKEQQ